MRKYNVTLTLNYGQLEELLIALNEHLDFRASDFENQEVVRHVQQVISKLEEQLEEQGYYNEY